MISKDDPRQKEIIIETNEGYEIDTKKLHEGESIQCHDDQDMTVIKNSDGTITLNKKCFLTKPFTR